MIHFRTGSGIRIPGYSDCCKEAPMKKSLTALLVSVLLAVLCAFAAAEAAKA